MAMMKRADWLVPMVEAFLDAPMPEPKAKESTASTQKPEDWPRLFEQSLNAGDLDAVMALYEPEARFVTRWSATSGFARYWRKRACTAASSRWSPSAILLSYTPTRNVTQDLLSPRQPCRMADRRCVGEFPQNIGDQCLPLGSIINEGFDMSLQDRASRTHSVSRGFAF
jgi:hypothetical protein